jgi:1-acyl-sn-glycerol-3-phosphate acyltransferase
MNAIESIRRTAEQTLGPFALPVELWADGISDMLDLVRGSVPGDKLDEWDSEYIRRTLPRLWWALSVYFRPDVRGLEHIPGEGPALLVGNHSGGTLIADSFVLAAAFYRRFDSDRRFHQLTHDIAARMPGLALLRRYGALRATHENAQKAFELGAPVLVYPGGDRETFRPSWKSGEIDLAGRTGFIRLALEAEVPIVPVVAIGGQETALFLSRGERLARLLRFDRLLRMRVLPVAIAPPFGLSILELPPRLPLPSQITIRVLEPVDLVEEFGADADANEVYDALEARMQQALDELSEERDLPVVGPLPTTQDGGPTEEEQGSQEDGLEGQAPIEAVPEEAGEADDGATVELRPTESGRPPTPGPRRADTPASDGQRDGAPPEAPDAQSPSVDAEDTLVAEVADQEAADGAGAELHVEEPWEGYRSMRVADIVERLNVTSAEVLAAVKLYEQSHRQRRGVLIAVDRLLNRG